MIVFINNKSTKLCQITLGTKRFTRKRKLVLFSVSRCIYILALKMASPWNQHCASCIGTLSFPI